MAKSFSFFKFEKEKYYSRPQQIVSDEQYFLHHFQVFSLIVPKRRIIPNFDYV
jgi:hypothetical protein